MQDHRYVLHLTMVYTNSGRISAADRLGCSTPQLCRRGAGHLLRLLNGAALFTFDVKREGLTAWPLAAAKTDHGIFRGGHHVPALLPLAHAGGSVPVGAADQLGSETVYAG